MQADWNELDDGTRVWGFAFENALRPDICENVLTDLLPYLDAWTSHQMPVMASVQWYYNRFLFIAGGDEKLNVSGCGIDAMRSNVIAVLSKHNLDPLEAGIVVWTDLDDNWHLCRWMETSVNYRERMKQSASAIYSPMPLTIAELRLSWPVKPSQSALLVMN